MDSTGLRVRDLEVFSDRGTRLVSLPALDLAPGETLGISGASGAGKSTLLFALAGLAARTSGRVVWGGQDLLAIGMADRAAFRARHVGMIFQDYLLFDELGALDNAAILAGFRPRRDRATLRAEAGARLRALDLPGDARDVSRFSGGERQRVAVARALAHGPQVLLADEPTASLDVANATTLADILIGEARQQDRMVVLVSHDPVLLGRMDRVITLSHGVLAA